MYYEKTDNSGHDIFNIVQNSEDITWTMGQVHIIGGNAYFEQFYSETHNAEQLRQIADFVEEIQQLTDNQKQIA